MLIQIYIYIYIFLIDVIMARYDEVHILHGILEYKAAAINMRSIVNEPIVSGYRISDIHFPIGRGQRMLLVGDSITGKSSFGVSCILSNYYNNLSFVYAAIGTNYSSLLRLVLPIFYLDFTNLSLNINLRL